MADREDPETTLTLAEVTDQLREIIGEISQATNSAQRGGEIIQRWEDLILTAVPEVSARARELVEALGELDRPMSQEEIEEVGALMIQLVEIMQRITQSDAPPTDAIILWYVRNLDERLRNMEGRL